MKNILTIFLLVFCVNVQAQNFEGTISWTIKTEIKDAKMKAQMEEAQQQMNDPAMQAQLKQMQEQMNDPQMKAMMESNPQMKAQMEKVMKMSSGGGMNDMFPTGMTVKIKNQNALTRMDGGMMTGDILYLSEKGQSYRVDRESKTYSVLSGGNNNGNDVKVTKTAESASILGYKCQKYQVEMTEQGKKLTQYIWATTELKGIDMRSLSDEKMRNSAIYKEIDGFPLKMQMVMPEMEMTMEAKEVKEQSLPANEFIIPSNFKEVKGMMGRN
ncbi:MAG: DUF4412 domain-containing protein [Cyclobacteriaceae bacterium]